MSIDRLTKLDRMMLWTSRTWPQDIGALAVIDGGDLFDEASQFRIDAVRDVVRGRLHRVPRFRQLIHQPRRGLGGPLWVDAPVIDLAHHVRELRLEPPTGEDALLTAVEQLLRRRLDPSAPLWEIWCLTGLPDRRVALFVRIHHTIADGMAALMTMAAFLDRSPDAAVQLPAPPWHASPWPSDGALLVDQMRRRALALRRSVSLLARPRETFGQLRSAWPAIRELLAEQPATATSLDRMVGPDRRVALIRASLESVRRVGRAHDATVNDVLLAVTAGGLRSLLQHRGEPLHDTTLRAYVPVSLRRHLHGLQQGNQIAQMAVPLDLSESDPGRRLRQLAADTTLRKARPRTNLGDLLVGGRIGRRLVLSAVMRQRVNLTTASIPGPTRPLYLAGARVLDVYPVLPLVANEPLGVGAISYAGDLTIGITADPDVYPDLDALSEAIRDDLLSLGVATLPPFEGRAFAARTGSMAAVGGRTGGADSWLAPAGQSTRAP